MIERDVESRAHVLTLTLFLAEMMIQRTKLVVLFNNAFFYINRKLYTSGAQATYTYY